MNMYASVAVCFIPLVAVFICFVLLVPEFKTKWGLLACLLGLLAVIPIAAFQFLIDTYKLLPATSLGLVLLEALILNGLIEESLKMGLLFVMPAKKINLPSFFACALLAGLAVGCFESVIYLISGYENISLRMVTAVIIHTACSGLSGLFVYSVHQNKARVASSPSSNATAPSAHIMPFIYAISYQQIL